MADHFPQKYMKKITPEFVDAINGVDVEEIKKRILECEGHLYEIDEAKENNEDLKAAKENYKNAAAGFTESKQIETAKIKYCLFVLQGRGIAL